MDQVSNVAEASVEEEQVAQTNEDTSGDCDTYNVEWKLCRAVMPEVRNWNPLFRCDDVSQS